MEPPFSHDTIPKSRYKKVASFEEFTIGIRPDNSVELLIDGSIYNGNVKQVLREKIAPMLGFSVDSSLSTHQLGSRLVNFINGKNNTQKSRTNKKGSGKSKKISTMEKKRNHQAQYQFLQNVINNQCSFQGRLDIINIMHSIANSINN